VLKSHFPLKRLIAALLPVAFLWLFAACVSSCARESAERQEHPIVSSAVDSQDAPDCKGCLLATFPQATAPERAQFKLHLQAPAFVPPLLLSLYPLTDVVIFNQGHLRPSFADPPLARLPILRI
jgi:hypothetical protein